MLLQPATGLTLVLNRTGSAVWSLLDGRRTLAEVAEAIAVSFDVAPEVASGDVLAFAHDLELRGLAHAEP